MFAELNSDALAQEMAQGRGEHVASLATLLGLPQEQHPAFFVMAPRALYGVDGCGRAFACGNGQSFE